MNKIKIKVKNNINIARIKKERNIILRKINKSNLTEFLYFIIDLFTELYGKNYTIKIKKYIILYFRKRKEKVYNLVRFLNKNDFSYEAVKKIIIDYHINRKKLTFKNGEVYSFILYKLKDLLLFRKRF